MRAHAQDRATAPWIALGLLAGAALPFQGAINARLRAELDAPIAAGALSFVVATGAMALVLAGALALGGHPRPRVAPLRRVPWWGWLGGLCGATYVTSVFLLIPEIGAAPTIALTVAGQQIASVLVDRYGLLRLPRRPITRRRLLGVTTLLAGVALIQLPDASSVHSEGRGGTGGGEGRRHTAASVRKQAGSPRSWRRRYDA